MNMKEHILAALQEQFDKWEELLASLDEEQLVAPRFDLDWSIKDVLTHLWAWQQISSARIEGGLRDGEPDYPQWIVSSVENWEADSDRVNAVTYERYHAKSWSEMYESWRNGFLQLLNVGNQISERDLLDGDRYEWLHGYSLAAVLVASYDHHQEHYEKVIAALT